MTKISIEEASRDLRALIEQGNAILASRPKRALPARVPSRDPPRFGFFLRVERPRLSASALRASADRGAEVERHSRSENPCIIERVRSGEDIVIVDHDEVPARIDRRANVLW